MNIVIDLIVSAIIVLCVILTAKRGFVKSVIGIAGFALAIILSLTLSTPISTFTYDKFISPGVESSIEASVKNNINSDVKKITDNVWNTLPKYVKNTANDMGINKNTVQNSVAHGNTAHETAVAVNRNAVRPVAVFVIKLLVSVILFIILSIIFKFVANFINKIFSFSIVGKANRLLGGILGLVKGVIYAIIFILLINFIVTVTGGFWLFTPNAISNTVIFKGILGVISAIL